MNEKNIHETSSVEELKKVSRMMDFVLYLIRSINEHIARLCDNLESLPAEFTTPGVAIVVNDVMDSMKVSIDLITKLMPSSKICNKEKYREFWYLHSALIFYHYDAMMLVRHSLLSAFTGYYSVASTELRNAMESIVRGMIFDLLAIPEYRRNAKELKKIKGFRNAGSFSELLDILERRLGNKRPETSVEIFDIIDEELKDFNPEATFIKLLLQLKEWDIIDSELLRDLDSYYVKLSELAHRVHPKFSEVGIRAEAQRDWLDLEPVPEEILIYLYNFIELNGLFTYLVLKVFSIDLIREEFRKCIDFTELEQDLDSVIKLANSYSSWKRVKDLLEQLEINKNVSYST
ncbi:MAG: hypothetical protein J7L82_04870 [Staphylothermus sp.]|nr:hypothetical protein [Staphylothermus sp.]